MLTDGCSCGSHPCANGHIIIWAGDPNYEISEGYPCACGQTVVKHVICPACGNKEIKMVEKEECWECKMHYPLEYQAGYGWFHANPNGPDLPCKNPEVIKRGGGGV